jgi:hypothetical protein
LTSSPLSLSLWNNHLMFFLVRIDGWARRLSSCQ